MLAVASDDTGDEEPGRGEDGYRDERHHQRVRGEPGRHPPGAHRQHPDQGADQADIGADHEPTMMANVTPPRPVDAEADAEQGPHGQHAEEDLDRPSVATE